MFVCVCRRWGVEPRFTPAGVDECFVAWLGQACSLFALQRYGRTWGEIKYIYVRVAFVSCIRRKVMCSVHPRCFFVLFVSCFGRQLLVLGRALGTDLGKIRQLSTKNTLICWRLGDKSLILSRIKHSVVATARHCALSYTLLYI